MGLVRGTEYDKYTYLHIYRDFCANSVSNEGGYDVLGMQLGMERQEMLIEFLWGILLQ
jgi:hypothetical protein